VLALAFESGLGGEDLLGQVWAESNCPGPARARTRREFRRVREYRSLDIADDAARRILPAMPLPPDRAWQLPWLRVNLLIRDVLAVAMSSRCRGERTGRS
jgi:hypothetical protein